MDMDIKGKMQKQVEVLEMAQNAALEEKNMQKVQEISYQIIGLLNAIKTL